MSTHALKGSLGLVFTDEVIARLKGAPRTDSLVYRVAVVTGVPPAGCHIPSLSAQRIAWSKYVDAARACGMFEAPHGKDLTTRLAHVDDDQFRSAMAECQAAWYLSSKLGLSVSARPRGKGTSVLELLVTLPDGDVLVEVKSPCQRTLRSRPLRTLKSGPPPWGGAVGCGAVGRPHAVATGWGSGTRVAAMARSRSRRAGCPSGCRAVDRALARVGSTPRARGGRSRASRPPSGCGCTRTPGRA